MEKNKVRTRAYVFRESWVAAGLLFQTVICDIGAVAQVLFFQTAALIVCLCACCDRTGGDPNQSGTDLYLQPGTAQPAGPL